MKDFVYISALFDCYEELLTDVERDNFKAYYCENYSMQEIAEEKNVSRSAVHKNIKNVIEKLNNYESKLHIHEKNMRLISFAEMLDEEKKQQLEKIINL